MYLNPGNDGFKEILNSSCYIDKTGIISLINSSINTMDKLICISRPRRFGKSFAAKTISAYYDCSCDSKALFDGKEISKSTSYEEHLNKYNVIYLDMTNIMGKTEPQNMISFITENITNELLSSYPNTVRGSSFDGTLLNVTEA
ncbi:MAG: AAA family ATPase, partial [Succinimonas sp.]|nr:AAA family ATPase [Succinimonas sp.]